MYINKLREESYGWLKNYGGFFITLNTVTKDKIMFEKDLGLLNHRLNDFCYGRAYKHKKNKLKTIAGIEIGSSNQNLHAHLIVTHDSFMKRRLSEVNEFVRSKWYKLINQSHAAGKMVDVQALGDLETRIGYITKDTNYMLKNSFNNILCF